MAIEINYCENVGKRSEVAKLIFLVNSFKTLFYLSVSLTFPN